MRCVVVGLGSIGRRHARLLIERPGVTVAALRHSDSADNDLGIPQFHRVADLAEFRPEVAWICNPTYRHFDSILQCLDMGIRHFFIEKPLDATAEKLDLVVERLRAANAITYVAYVLRFHPVVAFLKEWIAAHSIYHMRLVNISYLPNWRPGSDFRQNYAVRRSEGGGVLLDCSHEIDLVRYLAGPIQTLAGRFGRTTELTIDSEDFADIAFEANGISGSIYLSYFSTVSERTIEIDTEEGQLRADLNAATVRLPNGELKSFSTDRDMWYRNQIEYFFSEISNPSMMNNMIDAAELFRQIIAFRDHLR